MILGDRYWLVFTADHNVEDAKRRFVEKFAAVPEEVHIAKYLIIGPVPETQSIVAVPGTNPLDCWTGDPPSPVNWGESHT